MRRVTLGLVIVAMVVVWLGQTAPPGNRSVLASLDCSIFATQGDAQAVLDAGPADPASLDPDGNGIACDEESDATAGGATPDTGTPATEATPLPASPTPLPTPTVAFDTLFPLAEEVPAGLILARDDRRSRAEVAYQIAGQSPDPAAISAAEEQLRAWDFDAATVRSFVPDQTPLAEAPDEPPPPPPSGLRWLWVGVYRFNDPGATPAAFAAFVAAAQASDGRLREQDGARIGEDAVTLVADGDDGLFHLWFRTEFDVFWIGGTSSAGYPQAEIEALARMLLLRARGEAAGSGLRVGGMAATLSAANLRTEPSTEAAIVATLDPGTLLVITGEPIRNDAEGRDWWPVEVISTGQTGYVAAELLAST